MTQETFINVANNKLNNASVTSIFYGQGIIKECVLSDHNDLFINVVFKNITKSFKLSVAVKSKSIVFNDTTLDSQVLQLLSAEEKLIQEDVEKSQEESALKEIARQKSVADKKLAEQQEKFERKKEAAIAKFESKLLEHYVTSGTQEEYYYTLGFLAANIGTIIARLPDYLEPVFIRHFGADAHRYVVDSNRRTVSGYKPQWTYSFSATVKHRDVAPALVLQNLNESRTKLANTSFIWNLIDNHEFQFGKTQNIDKIRGTVPNCYIEWFNKGLNIVD